MPHLVLPLSGCLSRPPRQGQHEVRQGTQVSLSTEPFADVSPSFPSFGLVVGLVCPRHMVDWPNVFALLWLHPAWFRPMVLLCGHAGRQKGTQHDGPGSVCCLCIASRCECRPASGMSTPSRCRALVHSRCQWWCDLPGDNGPCEIVCVDRGRRTHIGYPRWSGRVGRMRVRSFGIPWWVCVVAVMGLL